MMNTQAPVNRIPAVYICHGGGPLPLLGAQNDVASQLKLLAASLCCKPKAIVVISAHWLTTKSFSVTCSENHSLLFDYGGFPAESYQLKYPAPGSPSIAQKVCNLLRSVGLSCTMDKVRGWDHGVFVPLLLMFPDADIPVVELSLHESLDPNLHVQLGQALSSLRDENVLLVGSGSSFHNFKYIFARDSKTRQEGIGHATAWNSWLVDTLTSNDISPEERIARLTSWHTAPGALGAHPLGQEDHLIPLHVILGSAGGGSAVCTGSREDDFVSSNFLWRA